MDGSLLGTIPGAGQAHSRRAQPSVLQWRGMFFFRSSQEPAIARLVAGGKPVAFEGPLDGTRGTLPVVVTSYNPSMGIAFFEGAPLVERADGSETVSA